MMLLSPEGALSVLSVPRLLQHPAQLVCILLALLGDTVRFLLLCLRPPAALVAENLFLSSSPSTKNDTASHGVRPTPLVSRWSGSVAGSTGVER